jgi:multiple sugar transport system permease protein
LVQPDLLERHGFPELAEQADPLLIQASKDQFENGKPEPYGRNCQMLYVLLDQPLQEALLDPDRPAIDILTEAANSIDAKLLGYVPEDEMSRRRGFATGILLFLLAAAVAGGIWWVRRFRATVREPKEAIGNKGTRYFRLAMLFLAPAAASLLVWAYYPLFRGLVIAFQDYRIMKNAKYVGMDNFIDVFTQETFYKGLFNSFLYVALTIGIGFFIPFLLALALNEIPRFKVFFRTIFYLPAMTSGIVIAFMWRQFYDKSENGFLNQLLTPVFEGFNWTIDLFNNLFHTQVGHFLLTHDWLGDPSWAMLAVVIPAIWAGAGPGSILYLAALKNVPEERYEAADLDGASWKHKIRHIVYPGLRPLVLINLLGAFIGGFKAMEQIFIMTAGGPLYATHTLGLEVWQNAFMFLKFGYATAAAWVMGAILIGFTVIQIRTLLEMKFAASSHA